MSKASIEAVAREAGVSIATVSRVLNGTKQVAPDTRARVEAAVKRLDFRVSPFGRGLSTGQSRLILMLVRDFANPFYAEITRGASVVARRAGYTLLPVDLETLPDDEACLQILRGGLADGVISLVSQRRQLAWSNAAAGRPWVNCSEYLPDDALVPHVSIDHRQAAAEAVQYLINRGHRRIALVNRDERFLYARLRREGYKVALARAGIPFDPKLVKVTDRISYAAGSEAAASLLSMENPPTAVFAVSDTLAIGLIKGFRRSGWRTPEDVAIVGFDDVPIAEVFEPSLTTVAQPMPALGEAAVEMLLDQLAGRPTAHRILPHRLVVRDSA